MLSESHSDNMQMGIAPVAIVSQNLILSDRDFFKILTSPSFMRVSVLLFPEIFKSIFSGGIGISVSPKYT